MDFDVGVPDTSLTRGSVLLLELLLLLDVFLPRDERSAWERGVTAAG